MTDAFRIDLPITPSPPPPAASIYGSTIGIMALASVAALFILCFYAVVARHCFIEHHEDEATLRQIAAARSGRLLVVSSSPPPSLGLDDAAVAVLPVVRYTGPGEGCAVCLSEYGDKQMVKVIPGCGHAFHPECIDVWLRWRGSCPVCRCSELWGPSGGREVWLDLFVCGEGNGGSKLGRSRSCKRDGVLMEGGGGGGAIVLRRTCSV